MNQKRAPRVLAWVSFGLAAFWGVVAGFDFTGKAWPFGFMAAALEAK